MAGWRRRIPAAVWRTPCELSAMFDETRLLNLIEAYVDQSLSAEERGELEKLLMASDEARRIFWERLRLHAVAREWALGKTAEDLAAGLPEAGKVVKFPWRRIAAGLAVAAAVVLAAFVFRQEDAGEEQAAPVADTGVAKGQTVAVLALASEAVWEGRAPVAGEGVRPGGLKLTAGTARLDFLSGAQMTLRAPAELSLVSEMKVMLLAGDVHVFAPPAAQGFTVETEGMIAVDRGTDFGMSAGKGKAPSLHVLSGRVDVAAMDAPDRFTKVFGGSAVRPLAGDWEVFPADRGLFPESGNLAGEVRAAQASRKEAWKIAADEFSRRDDVLIHYLFDLPEYGDENHVKNSAAHGPPETDATLVGSEWAAGRWPGKGSCSFTKATDRVRFVVPGAFRRLTLMAWVKVDRLPNQLNILLRPDAVQFGTPHWQFDPKGRLRLGYQTGKKEFLVPDGNEQTEWDVAVSPPFMKGELGRWTQVATVYDADRAVVEHFHNGRKIADHRLKHPMPLIFGPAQIGNTVTGGDELQYNLMGRVDEFAMVAEALSETEIRALYEAGKP